jgi:hypothetical protein
MPSGVRPYRCARSGRSERPGPRRPRNKYSCTAVGLVYPTRTGLEPLTRLKRARPETGADDCICNYAADERRPRYARTPHPVTPGDTLPANCGYDKTTHAGGRQYGGLSGRDWYATLVGGPKNVYAYDRYTVYRADSLMTQADFARDANNNPYPRRNTWRSHLTTWPRYQSTAGGGACSIIDMS